MGSILVTGAAGFIGRQLSDSLISNDFEVIELDDLSTKPLLAPKKNLIAMKVQDVNADFLISNNIECIIHLAAKKNVKDSFFNMDYSTENFDMTHKLLNASAKSGVKRFFLASSCEIFGYQNNILKEKSTLKPHSPYAVSKVANEYLSDVYMMYNDILKVTSLVFFNTYGPTEGVDAVIPNFVSKVSSGEPIVIEGDGNQARDFTFIDDTIQVLINIIKSKKYFRYINIGSGKDITIKKLVSIIKSLKDEIEINYVDQRPNEIKTFVAENSIIKKNFGFSPKIDINEGIKKVIKYYDNIRRN
jgi:nucleoside-diphosphate-sugar epimerase